MTEIPLFLRQAVIATEDARFYRHHGIDLRGLARAFFHNLRAGRIEQGGSTITQQLAKITFLTPERTIWRKIADMAYAVRLERRYSKDEILRFYLNQIYLGHGAFGMEAAAQTYFGRHVWEINHKEAMLLAGLIRGPERYSPFRNKQAAAERIQTVAELMQRYGGLTEEESQRFLREPLRLLPAPGRLQGGYFVAQLIADLRTRFGWSEEFIRRGGLEIWTTMDLKMQRAAEETIRLLPIGYRDAEGIPQPEGAIVAMEPNEGAVRVLVGGRDHLLTPLNRATRAHRQPGSAIKPFAYAAALEAGFSPETIYPDEPTVFWIDGRTWQPRNYDDIYRGPITLREALVYSVNVVAASLVRDLGPRRVFELARRMGLESLVPSGKRNDVGLAPLALGGLTRGVTPFELTAAYAAFANGGFRVRPFLFTRILDRRGRVIAAETPRRERVITPRTAALMTEMMQGVVERGTGVRARIDRPAAGKTGTTSDYSDGWFIGYTPELLAGVWIGNDQSNRPMKTAEGYLGSGTAASLWAAFMNRALNLESASPAPPQESPSR
ncbi:MAG: PBP1A family penicillin-binding protein [Firmicutes bacterium]|nr:PBP1A family penicillin-binding protein [Bacillota bacterium]